MEFRLKAELKLQIPPEGGTPCGNSRRLLAGFQTGSNDRESLLKLGSDNFDARRPGAGAAHTGGARADYQDIAVLCSVSHRCSHQSRRAKQKTATAYCY